MLAAAPASLLLAACRGEPSRPGSRPPPNPPSADCETITVATLGGASARAHAINDTGVVVGAAQDGSGIFRAFRWTREEGSTRLVTPGTGESAALDVNDRGDAAGWFLSDLSLPAAVRWKPDGTLELLGAAGATQSRARAINAAGVAVGVLGGSGSRQGVIWSVAGVPQLVGTLGGRESEARDVSDAGLVVGVAHNAEGNVRAFRLTPGGTPQDLGTLGGRRAEAWGVNSLGDVAGQSETAGGSMRATLWTAGGEILDLGTLGGSDSSVALAVNDAGVVVGVSWFGTTPRAFAWRRTTGIAELGPNGSQVVALSAEGEAVGTLGSAAAPRATTWCLRERNRAPVARLGAAPAAREGIPATLDASGSTDANDDALSYDWDFGDGTTGTGAQPAHAFPDDGTYSVRVRVTDGDGGVDSARTTVTVTNVAPAVSLGSDITAPFGDFLGFLARVDDPGRDAKWRYAADWGDGQQQVDSTDVIVPGIAGYHHFNSQGTFRIVFTVTDKDGASGTDTVNVTVRTLSPTGTLSIDLMPGTAPNRLSAAATGVFPVAVLGTASFDVATLDPASALLGNNPVGYVSPLVNSAQCGGACTRQQDVNGDGRVDLVLSFLAQDVVRGMVLEPQYRTLELMATVSATGQLLRGTDGITMLP